MDLQPHQQRVVAEKAELDEKLVKLLSFFQMPMFKTLPEAERSRLRNQARFMDGYAAVLEERIEAFLAAPTFVDIVFDGPPSHVSGRFVEVEDSAGKSIKFGEWIQRADGYWVLRIESGASA